MANQLAKEIAKFYGDTTRSQAQTAAGLKDAIQHARTLLKTLPKPDKRFDG